MSKIKCILLVFLVLICGNAALAQTEPSPSANTPASKIKTVNGPADIKLGASQGHLNLPAGFKFVNKTDAEELLRTGGDPVSEGVLGLVSDGTEGLDWFALLRYVDCGYIRVNPKVVASGIYQRPVGIWRRQSISARRCSSHYCR